MECYVCKFKQEDNKFINILHQDIQKRDRFLHYIEAATKIKYTEGDYICKTCIAKVFSNSIYNVETEMKRKIKQLQSEESVSSQRENQSNESDTSILVAQALAENEENSIKRDKINNNELLPRPTSFNNLESENDKYYEDAHKADDSLTDWESHDSFNLSLKCEPIDDYYNLVSEVVLMEDDEDDEDDADQIILQSNSNETAKASEICFIKEYGSKWDKSSEKNENTMHNCPPFILKKQFTFPELFDDLKIYGAIPVVFSDTFNKTMCARFIKNLKFKRNDYFTFDYSEIKPIDLYDAFSFLPYQESPGIFKIQPHSEHMQLPNQAFIININKK